ncbi:hypothetical protein Mmah_1070 [Methanohalophilus mahii DSM 5219]|uniref:Uncharacterized protein n=1 Tax=Methanohalophilus mahii (strain ATCC 35705 / DSM 5219 / SLP) TaxID=547558 RepID=D5EBM8_METMS|nr:hypothetical protein Mmah_1070 [Methanohalophilus mahii DSM 5219]
MNGIGYYGYGYHNVVGFFVFVLIIISIGLLIKWYLGKNK